MTNLEWLMIGWIALSTCGYMFAILWYAPKIGARRWAEHFEKEPSAQESLIKILMGKDDTGVIPIIVSACGEVVTENLKKTFQGYQGKSMQMLEKSFDPEGAIKMNKQLEEYPFYVRVILQKVLEKYGGALGQASTETPEVGQILGKIGLDKP